MMSASTQSNSEPRSELRAENPALCLCRPEEEVPEGMRVLFAEQASLLESLVKPSPSEDALSQYCSRDIMLPNRSGASAFVNHVREASSAYEGECRRDSNSAPLYFDVICFDGGDGGRAYVASLPSLSAIPFQGFGGFALAILPSDVYWGELNYYFSKIAISRFIGLIPQSVECVVVARAARFRFKGLTDLAEHEVPLLFDFSGRSNKDKSVVDPTDGVIGDQHDVRIGNKAIPTFCGTLTEEQVEAIGDVLAEKNARIASREFAAGIGGAGRWPLSLLEPLSFGRECFPDIAEQEVGECCSGSSAEAWQMLFAKFPPKCTPNGEADKSIKRARNIGTIWNRSLAKHGVGLDEVFDQDGEIRVADGVSLRELGEEIGADKLIESYYAGAPITDIVKEI